MFITPFRNRYVINFKFVYIRHIAIAYVVVVVVVVVSPNRTGTNALKLNTGNNNSLLYHIM